jgi:hypothetical protein
VGSSIRLLHVDSTASLPMASPRVPRVIHACGTVFKVSDRVMADTQTLTTVGVMSTRHMAQATLPRRLDRRHTFAWSTRNFSAFTVILALGLAACGDDEPRGLDVLDVLDADDDDDPSPSSTPTHSTRPAATPSVFEHTLDVSAVNIASALDQHCFNTGPGRRAFRLGTPQL